MSGSTAKPNAHVDKKTAKGKGEGGFSPHPTNDNDDGFQGEVRRKDQARQVRPSGKSRSK